MKREQKLFHHLQLYLPYQANILFSCRRVHLWSENFLLSSLDQRRPEASVEECVFLISANGELWRDFGNDSAQLEQSWGTSCSKNWHWGAPSIWCQVRTAFLRGQNLTPGFLWRPQNSTWLRWSSGNWISLLLRRWDLRLLMADEGTFKGPQCTSHVRLLPIFYWNCLTFARWARWMHCV